MILDKIHKKFIYDNRIIQLYNNIKYLAKDSTFILDIGAGDGKLDKMLMDNTDLSIIGIDVLVRDTTYIPVLQYDGKHILREDNSTNTTMLIDVLHHTDNPEEVFKEVVRVTNKYIIIKDHIKTNTWSYIKLKLMDIVGNKSYGVSLPYNYLTKSEWQKLFKDNNLRVVKCKTNLHLYKGICHKLFDSNLHFIALLEKV